MNALNQKSLELDSLIIEVTRQCNMTCEHCLRGCSENKVFDVALLPYILKNVRHINSITFTGGEPSLHPEIIDAFIDYVEEHDISISNFFIATNCSFYSEKFILAVLRLYTICEEKEYCSLAVSIDIYHDELNQKTFDIYKSFVFYSDCKENGDYNNGQWIINRGNANSYGIGETEREIVSDLMESNFDEYEDTIIVNDSLLYVSSNGIVCCDCDLDYESIDSMEYSIGKISKENSLLDIISKKVDQIEKEIA